MILPRRVALFACAALACLLSGKGFSDQKALEQPRLSGTIVISETDRRAIVSYESGKSVVLAVGEQVEGWGSITAIESGEMRIKTPAGEEAVMMSSGHLTYPRRPKAERKGETSAVAYKESFKRGASTTPAVASEIDRLILTNASGLDLGDALAELLELPASVRITGVDHEQLSAGSETLRHVKHALEQGNAVRLSIEGEDVEDFDAVYLFPPPGIP